MPRGRSTRARSSTRFLALESCGQCSHSKQDGLGLADLLARLVRSQATDADRTRIDSLLATVADGARCNLALQHQTVVANVLRDGEARLDRRECEKQPDWSSGGEDSGKWPADRLAECRASEIR